MDITSSPSFVAVTPELLLSPSESLIELGPTGVPSQRQSPFKLRTEATPTDRSTLFRSPSGRIFGLASDGNSIIQTSPNSVREADRLKVTGDENVELTSVMPGREHLFALAIDRNGEDLTTLVYTISDNAND
jgi:hypothetical protein